MIVSNLSIVEFRKKIISLVNFKGFGETNFDTRQTFFQ